MYVLNVRDILNNNDKRDKLIEYLNKHGFNNFEEDVFKNMVFLFYDDVFGTMSFEVFGNIALIRYFIYSKNVSFNNVRKMFKVLCNVALSNKVKCIISLCDEDIKDVFISLGFDHLSEDLIFFDELCISKSNIYKNKKAYIFSLNKE